MKTYLVGGAVRDQLLGVPVVDRDWVVVGATPEQMKAQGYRQVGRDFPVFLHPDTAEEYALARTERKTAPGYHGFAFDTSPDITIEQDLQRRDLTINAMAQDAEGRLVDPWGGARDLERRVLRHVSTAFREDPVRILRVARFAARYADRGFTVAPETLTLMREMVAAGEVDALVAERVWLDTQKALAEPRPAAFVATLRACGALARLLPEVDRLYGIPQRADYHPEIDAGLHLGMVLDQAAALSQRDPLVVFAALLHDLGKALTPRDEWPRHHRHDAEGVEPVREVCRRLKVPRDYQRLAELVCRYHIRCHRVFEMRPTRVHDLVVKLDGMRQPEMMERFLVACTADTRGRLGLADKDYPQADFLRDCRSAMAAVDARELADQGLTGEQLGQALRRARSKAIAAVRERYPQER